MILERRPGIGMTVLFGSYARGDWREAKDLTPDYKSSYPPDYDFLV